MINWGIYDHHRYSILHWLWLPHEEETSIHSRQGEIIPRLSRWANVCFATNNFSEVRWHRQAQKDCPHVVILWKMPWAGQGAGKKMDLRSTGNYKAMKTNGKNVDSSTTAWGEDENKCMGWTNVNLVRRVQQCQQEACRLKESPLPELVIPHLHDVGQWQSGFNDKGADVCISESWLMRDAQTCQKCLVHVDTMDPILCFSLGEPALWILDEDWGWVKGLEGSIKDMPTSAAEIRGMPKQSSVAEANISMQTNPSKQLRGKQRHFW